MKRALPPGLGGAHRVFGALLPCLAWVILFFPPLLYAQESPGWLDELVSPRYVVLEVSLAGQTVKLATRDSVMVTLRQPGHDLYLGLIPRVVEPSVGSVEIEVVELQPQNTRSRVPRIVRRVESLAGQVGFTSYVSPIDAGALVDVSVVYIGRSPWRPMGLPPQMTAASRTDGTLPGPTAQCCLRCGGVESCGCAVGTSCGMCCQGCCQY